MTYVGMAITFVISSLIVNVIWAGVQYLTLRYKSRKLEKLFKQLYDLEKNKTDDFVRRVDGDTVSREVEIDDNWIARKTTKPGKLH